MLFLVFFYGKVVHTCWKAKWTVPSNYRSMFYTLLIPAQVFLRELSDNSWKMFRTMPDKNSTCSKILATVFLLYYHHCDCHSDTYQSSSAPVNPSVAVQPLERWYKEIAAPWNRSVPAQIWDKGKARSRMYVTSTALGVSTVNCSLWTKWEVMLPVGLSSGEFV